MKRNPARHRCSSPLPGRQPRRLLMPLVGFLSLLPTGPTRADPVFGHLTLDRADALFIGEGLNEQTGWSVSYAGDFNGDGYDDFLLGAQLNDQGEPDAGKAYLVFGSPARFLGEFDLTQADGRFTGEQAEDYAGATIARAGDVDGDGLEDILVGAWGNDEAGGATGKTYLIHGSTSPPGEVMLETVPSAFTGEGAGDASGYCLCALGDLDGDGYDDFAIGAPNHDTVANNAGRVYILMGGPERPVSTRSLSTADIIIDGAAANDLFGHAIAGGVDLDQDGLPDLAIGAHGSNLNGEDSGAVYVFSGASLTRGGRYAATDAAAVIFGAAPGDQFGYSVTLSPDVDGDHIGDLFVGATRVSDGANWNGAGILVPGAIPLSNLNGSASQGIVFPGDSDNDKAGRVVGTTGDMDGDGLGDLLLAAPYADVDGEEGVGKVALIFGGSSLAGHLLGDTPDLFTGIRDSGLAGFSIAGDGDVDGDGHPDLFIGAAGIGRVYLILTGRYFDDDGDGVTEAAGDCDDEDPATQPGATDIPYDGTDQDCSGSDETDLDGDGYDAVAAGGTDCDDQNPEVSPGAEEIPDGVDQNCNGTIDEGTILGDDDGDGFSPIDGDCDDQDPFVHPGQPELANGVDDDCDGSVDEDLPSTDDDGDGLSEDEGDCDDHDPTIYPGAQELDDPVDHDCDGTALEQAQVQDQDNDGFSTSQGDLDDSDPSIYPGAIELPDGKDNDGDGTIDEGAFDLDGDGFSPAQGDPDDSDPDIYPGSDTPAPQTLQDQDGDGFSTFQGDCDDSNPFVHPGAPETENGLDDNCDGRTDEQTAAYDDDGDGYSELEGDLDDSDPSVHPPAPSQTDPDAEPSGGDETPDPARVDRDGDGYSPDDGDCDDDDPETYPGAPEQLDGIDNDCNLLTDDQTSVSDDDGDGFAEVDGDCDDDSAGISPDAEERCNGHDDDCDGITDEGCATPTPGPGDGGDLATPPPSPLPSPAPDAEPTPPTNTWYGAESDDDTSGRRLFRGLGCGCDTSSVPPGRTTSVPLGLAAIILYIARRRDRLSRSPREPNRWA